MTPMERAEKIVKIFMGYEKAQNKSFYDQVLLEIEEVQKEAHLATEQIVQGMTYSLGYDKGFEAAREKAATIAYDFDDTQCLPKCDSYAHEELCPLASTPKAIAERIRTMESDK